MSKSMSRTEGPELEKVGYMLPVHDYTKNRSTVDAKADGERELHWQIREVIRVCDSERRLERRRVTVTRDRQACQSLFQVTDFEY
jgi:hypothetical protein